MKHYMKTTIIKPISNKSKRNCKTSNKTEKTQAKVEKKQNREAEKGKETWDDNTWAKNQVQQAKESDERRMDN